MSETPSNFLQENLLILLLFNDDHAKFIRNTVPQNYFEGDLFEFAKRSYRYIDKYGEPPKEHIADLFEDILEDEKDEKKADRFDRLILSFYDAKDTVNSEYVISQIETFIRAQTLKEGFLEAADYIQSGDEESLSEAENILNGCLKKRLSLFDPGARLTDFDRSFSFLDRDRETFPTGVKVLDSTGNMPARKELFVFIGLAKAGKTWHLTGIGRNALMRGHKVLHITLEVDEDIMAKRYYQSFFAIGKGKEEQTVSRFVKDGDGFLEDLEIDDLTPDRSFEDADIKDFLKKKVSFRGAMFGNLIIKGFPTGQLTMNQLRAYLDSLQDSEGFTPDLLIVDYPKIMKHNSENLRTELGQTFESLRGLGVERNMGVVGVHQSNRTGLKEKIVDVGNAGEDFSVVQTADTIVTYSRTDAEKQLGLARMLIAGSRTQEDRIAFLISQNYYTGQFCLDSVRMPSEKRYMKMVKGLGEDNGDDD